MSFDTQIILHNEASIQRDFSPQTFLHRENLAQGYFDTEELLRANAFTHKKNTQKLLHTEAFTHTSSCSEDFLPCTVRNTEKFVHRLNFVMLQNRKCPLFLPFDPHFVRNSRIRDFQIAILPQCSPFGLHFV